MLRQKLNGSTQLEFLYGKEGLLGFVYNEASYLYQKNIFGDIVKIVDNTGAIVAEYSYTAFGECTVLTDLNNIANINPFRYRGYYLESNSGLYYLKTRFYNPITGRFISPDDTKYLQPDTINGVNLFAYCGNNPVMNVDPNGTFFFTALIVGSIIGAGIGFGTTVYKDYKDDGKIFNGSIKWYEYVGATALGGLIGAGVGAGIAWIAPSISSFAASTFTFGGGLSIFGGTAAVSAGITITGTQILVGAGAIALGLNVLFSKNKPGMSTKPPVSWTSIEEGKNALIESGGNTDKAVKQILNRKWGKGNWTRDYKYSYNELHKWIDRVLRELLNM